VDGRLLPLRYAYTRDDMIRALIDVAARLREPLTSSRYTNERVKMHDESWKRGELVSLPSADTIRNYFGSWKLALEAAGLPTVATHLPPFTGGRRPSYTRDEKIEWARKAWAERGEPFTVSAYSNWRRTRAAAGLDPGPSASCLQDTFGNWSATTAQAHPSLKPPRRRRVHE